MYDHMKFKIVLNFFFQDLFELFLSDDIFRNEWG